LGEILIKSVFPALVRASNPQSCSLWPPMLNVTASRQHGLKQVLVIDQQVGWGHPE